MTEGEQILRDILCWAAGAPVDVSGIPSVDPQRLLIWIARHKLAVRFVRRAQAERPHWYTRALSIPLWQEGRQIRSTVERHITATQEVAQAAQASGLPSPIPLKGFTTYALTGDDGVLRPSSDLDLLADDPDALIALLTRLGFANMGAHCRDHEAAKMQRGGVKVEVHRHVPVRSYLETLGAHMDGADQVGWSFQTAEPTGECRPIEYADFRQHLTAGAAPEMRSLLLPSPTLAVLVLCVHSFRDYIERGMAWLNHPIPLADLADLRDLAARPEFDADAFCALAESVGAQHSVEATARMLEIWLGVSPLPSLAGPPSIFHRRSIFPQRVSWVLGVWAYLGPLENLPVRSWDSALAALGEATTIDMTGPACAYATPGASGTPFVTAIVREVEGERLPVSLTVSATDTRLTIQAEMPPLPLGDDDAFKFSFDGGQEILWRYNGPEYPDRPVMEKLLETLPSEASVVLTEDGYRFCLNLPLRDSLSFYMTFEAERWMVGLDTLIPLRIICKQPPDTERTP